MKIIRLEIDNFKRLRAVRIQPDGSMILIEGRNAQGKTSVLDAVWAVFGGGRAAPEEPIHAGRKRGSIKVNIGDYQVERVYTAKSSTLKVTKADGTSMPRPQEFLDSLHGGIIADPMEFLRLRPTEQVAELRRLLRIDTAQLDRDREATYAERTDQNRRVRDLEGRLRDLPPAPAGALAEEVDAGDLAQRLAVATESSAAASRMRQDAEAADRRHQEAERALRAAETALNKARAEVKRSRVEADQAAAKAVEASASVIDPAPIREQLQNIDATNRAVRAAQQRKAAEVELDKARQVSESLTARIEEIDSERQRVIQSAPYPVEGLAVTDAGVQFGGVPLAQASSAEQLRISVALALARQPELKVILVRDGSLLDQQSLALLGELVDAHGAEVWLERVSDGDPDDGAIVIEDGEVKA